MTPRPPPGGMAGNLRARRVDLKRSIFSLTMGLAAIFMYVLFPALPGIRDIHSKFFLLVFLPSHISAVLLGLGATIEALIAIARSKGSPSSRAGVFALGLVGLITGLGIFMISSTTLVLTVIAILAVGKGV